MDQIEIIAIWKVLKYYKEQGIQQIKVEIDSLCQEYNKECLKKSWKIIEKLEATHGIMEITNIHFEHIFGEANQLANFITNITISQEGKAVV